MKFCTNCGAPLQLPFRRRSPAALRVRRLRHHPLPNPRLVVGCVPEHEGRILLCRRAIEPRRGYWTVPAGFMENGETLQQARGARVAGGGAAPRSQIGSLLAVVHVLHAEQVHVFFRAALPAGPLRRRRGEPGGGAV